jgi:hypothetical protein
MEAPTTVSGGLLGDSTFAVLVADNNWRDVRYGYVDTDMTEAQREIRMEVYSAGGQTHHSATGTAQPLFDYPCLAIR